MHRIFRFFAGILCSLWLVACGDERASDERLEDAAGAADPCEGVSCSERGACGLVAGAATCVCDDGYHAEGLDCVEAPDPCAEVTCSDAGACVIQGEAVACLCDDGYHAEGTDCVEDLDLCAGVSCSDHGLCALQSGAPSCVCDAGYQADGLDCVDLCEDITCSNHGACAVTAQSQMTLCFCDEGYHAEGLDCVETIPEDPCEGVTCSAQGACVVDAEGAPLCECDDGFSDWGSRTSCFDIDECEAAPCHADASCENTPGGFTCECLPGFDGDGALCDRRAFKLAVLPDTQHYSLSQQDLRGLLAQVLWVTENIATENILFALQLGDLVEHGARLSNGEPNIEEWDRIDLGLSLFDVAGLPWSVIAGNHDLDAVNDPTSDHTFYRAYFGPITTGRFDAMPTFGGVSANELNTYHLIDDGARQYLLLNLELDVPDSAIDWAKGVLAAHPGMPTIMVTHTYLGTQHGPPFDVYLEGAGRNSPLQVWEKLINESPQIFMVLNGHTWEEIHRTNYNALGQPVFEMVSDFSRRVNAGDGWLRLIELDEAAGEVRVQTFTPGLNGEPARFERDANSEFTFALDWGRRFDGEPPPPYTPPATSPVDDFETDSVARYTPSGDGSLSVTGGVLQLDMGASDVMAATLDDGATFVEPQTRWAIDVLDAGEVTLYVSTTPAPPDGVTNSGVLLSRGDVEFVAARLDATGAVLDAPVADPGGPMTLWVDRVSETYFAFYYQIAGQPRVLAGWVELPDALTRPQMFIGMRYQNPLSRSRFDALRAGPIAPSMTTIDAFDADSAAQYRLTDEWGSGGGTLEIRDHALHITSPGNTVSVMRDDGATFLRPGTRAAITVLDDNGQSFFQLSTIPSQPDAASSFGFRVRRDPLGLAVQRYTSAGIVTGGFQLDPRGPITCWVDRLSDTEFEFYYQLGASPRVLIERATLPPGEVIDEMFIGAQFFSSNVGTSIPFDDLRVEAIP